MADQDKFGYYNIPRGTKFEVQHDKCHVSITTFEGRGAAGVIEHGRGHSLKKGDIIIFDHVAYLGSDPGPGEPWFIVPGVGEGGFWPSDWGWLYTKDLKQVVE